MAKAGSIWTIGHSVHTIACFTEMLQSFDIHTLADVRTYPGSKIHTQFNQAALSASLAEAGILYIHLPELGGKRPASAGGNGSFGSYTHYMQTDAFIAGIEKLTAIAAHHRVAYMCAEALWWQCHRSKISDQLFLNGWQVTHIMAAKRGLMHKGVKEKVQQGRLF